MILGRVIRLPSLPHKKGIFHIPFLCRNNNDPRPPSSKIPILSLDFFPGLSLS